MKGPVESARKNRGLLTPFGVALFLLSLVYIAAEAVFNMQLVDVAGSVKSSPAEIDRLQHFGRAVSAYGFALLILGAFAGSGFRLTAKRYWLLFGALSAVSLIPFAMKVQEALGGIEGEPAPHADPLELQFCALPFLGIALVFLSAGRFRVHLLIGLVLMAWPSMYLGQKLLIERHIVDRTTWEERQNARYMLMLRAALEDCVMELDGLQFCDARRGAAEMKSARIVVSTLWMLSPKTVLADLQAQREGIVENAAATGMWFSPQEQYDKYVKKVAETRGRYVNEISDRYFKPYRQASDAYLKALDPAALQEEADSAAREAEEGIGEGWAKYQAAVREYRQSMSLSANTAVRQMLPLAAGASVLCEGRNCPDVSEEIGAAVREARLEAERKFVSRSGYPSTIGSREAFIAHPRTQEGIRQGVEKLVREKYGLRDFTLPEGWTYDADSFRAQMKELIGQQAQAGWRARFGDRVPPGLDEARFLAALGVEGVPPLEQLLMSQEQFYREVVVPGNRRIADGMLADLAKDKEKYPLRATYMHEGKDYVQAMYIPALSLVISLAVVVLTLLRGFVALMDMVLRSGDKAVERRWLYAGRAAMVLFFIVLVTALPRLFPNPYASGPAYERYFASAAERHPVIAAMLDWSVQVQPVIYRMGQDLRRLGG